MSFSTQAPSLETTVGGIHLNTCVYNASGPRTGSSEALAKIAASSSGAVLAKSATVEKQTGNPLPRTWHHEPTLSPSSEELSTGSIASLNSEGLPNSGIKYYIDPITIQESIGETSKPYMISISGKTLQDNLQMLTLIHTSSPDVKSSISAIELNLACPNVIGKPIIAYDFEQLKSVLEAVSQHPLPKEMPLGVKLSPYFDRPHLQRAASIINEYSQTVKYVVCINTIGYALAIDIHSEMPAIRSNGGLAGLSGAAVKYTALANVRQLRQILVESIDIVGVGGVSSGKDAFEMILCGASAVQVGTCHWNEGPGCFDRICTELRELMSSKGYTSIRQFKGQLKEWSREGASLSRKARAMEKELVHDKTTITTTKTMNNNQMYQFISAVLAAIVAFLLADKFELVSL
mmetsp:Transcript_21980/g.30896  ORF Transcript_21980/g.30896 Transcript_21980/m.30896 type:complete len:405 (-) Transcript_21980:174-1388(-)